MNISNICNIRLQFDSGKKILLFKMRLGGYKGVGSQFYLQLHDVRDINK